MTSDTTIKANFGCGIHAPPNWENFDASFRVWLDKVPGLSLLGYQKRFAPWVHRLDVGKGLPFKDGSVDLVYSSHMIEHLNKNEVVFFFKECARILKPGGRIRLMTPNIVCLVQNYLGRRNDPALRNTAADLFTEWLGAIDTSPSENPIKRILNRLQSKNLHQWFFDEYSLKRFLEEVGFKDVKVQTNWLTDFPDIDLLEPEDLRLSSACAEASR